MPVERSAGRLSFTQAVKVAEATGAATLSGTLPCKDSSPSSVPCRSSLWPLSRPAFRWVLPCGCLTRSSRRLLATFSVGLALSLTGLALASQLLRLRPDAAARGTAAEFPARRAAAALSRLGGIADRAALVCPLHADAGGSLFIPGVRDAVTFRATLLPLDGNEDRAQRDHQFDRHRRSVADRNGRRGDHRWLGERHGALRAGRLSGDCAGQARCGATIGLRAIVMGGVEVGEKARVLAGSFVLPQHPHSGRRNLGRDSRPAGRSGARRGCRSAPAERDGRPAVPGKSSPGGCWRLPAVCSPGSAPSA
jgi:hypothetical protein